MNGLAIKGQARHIKKLSIKKEQAYIIVRNNGSALIIKHK
jgi:hypothetical protein